jgi:hypothetical protein
MGYTGTGLPKDSSGCLAAAAVLCAFVGLCAFGNFFVGMERAIDISTLSTSRPPSMTEGDLVIARRIDTLTNLVVLGMCLLTAVVALGIDRIAKNQERQLAEQAEMRKLYHEMNAYWAAREGTAPPPAKPPAP